MFSERAEGKRWVPRAKYIQETRGCQTENTSDAVPTPQPPCVLHAQTDRPLTSPVLSGLTCEVGGRCHARGWGHVGGGTWVWLVCPPWPPSLRPSVDGLSSWGPEGACGKMLLSIPGCEPCPPSAQRWLLQMPGGEGLPGMHGLGTEAVPSRAPGSGWSRSDLWLRWVFTALRGPSQATASRGRSCSAQAPPCSDFGCRAWALRPVSLHLEMPGLQFCCLVAQF